MNPDPWVRNLRVRAERVDDFGEGFEVRAVVLRADLGARDESRAAGPEPQGLDVRSTRRCASNHPSIWVGKWRHRQRAMREPAIIVDGDDEANAPQGQTRLLAWIGYPGTTEGTGIRTLESCTPADATPFFESLNRTTRHPRRPANRVRRGSPSRRRRRGFRGDRAADSLPATPEPVRLHRLEDGQPVHFASVSRERYDHPSPRRVGLASQRGRVS